MVSCSPQMSAASSPNSLIIGTRCVVRNHFQFAKNIGLGFFVVGARCLSAGRTWNIGLGFFKIGFILIFVFLRSTMHTQITTLFWDFRGLLFNGLCLRPIPKPFTSVHFKGRPAAELDKSCPSSSMFTGSTSDGPTGTLIVHQPKVQTVHRSQP